MQFALGGLTLALFVFVAIVIFAAFPWLLLVVGGIAAWYWWRRHRGGVSE